MNRIVTNEALPQLSGTTRIPGHPIVSIGAFCMASAMIEATGVRQPSYPFDDIFSTVPIVIHCLEDDFEVFLDRQNFIPLEKPTDWVQRYFRDAFGQQITFAHHDMALDANLASFERKVARFRAIQPQDKPLFVYVDYADRMPGSEDFGRLRKLLEARFGDCGVLVISFGPVEPPVHRSGHSGILFRHRVLRPGSRVDGVAFTDSQDNEALMAFISEATTITQKNPNINTRPAADTARE